MISPFEGMEIDGFGFREQPPPLPAFHPQTPAHTHKIKVGFRDPVPWLSLIVGVLVVHVCNSAVPANRDAMTKANHALSRGLPGMLPGGKCWFPCLKHWG